MAELELKIGGKAKFSNFYLQILRGNYRKKAETQIFDVVELTEHSVSVKEVGSTAKYGTQHSRRYLVPIEVEVKPDQDLYCRYCLKPITKDTPGAVPDVDPVTNEQSGYRHLSCQPVMEDYAEGKTSKSN